MDNMGDEGGEQTLARALYGNNVAYRASTFIIERGKKRNIMPGRSHELTAEIALTT